VKKLWFLPAIVALVLTWYYYAEWQHWISHATGSYDVPGVAHHYNFFSGFGSDLGEYVIATSIFSHVAILWRIHTCHYSWWCWRHPHHDLEGTPFKICGYHHPDVVPVTAKQVVKERNGTAS
jgi:hypothetical protein